MILDFVMTTKNEEEDIECYIIINCNRHNITYMYMFLYSIKIIIGREEKKNIIRSK